MNWNQNPYQESEINFVCYFPFLLATLANNPSEKIEYLGSLFEKDFYERFTMNQPTRQAIKGYFIQWLQNQSAPMNQTFQSYFKQFPSIQSAISKSNTFIPRITKVSTGLMNKATKIHNAYFDLYPTNRGMALDSSRFSPSLVIKSVQSSVKDHLGYMIPMNVLK